MFCTNCGAELRNGVKFCPTCGARVGGATDVGQIANSPRTQVVAAKCTNCGAGLQVDPNLQAAICPFCHTPYIVEKAIQNFNITNNYIIQGPDAGNLLSLSENAIKAGKYSEALDYANRALEADPRNVDAWVCKILIAGHDINGDRSSEISSFIESALDSGAGDEDEIKIYSTVLEVAIIHMQEAANLLKSNTETIEKQLRDRRDKRDIAAMDSGYIAGMTRITNEGIEYRNLVPNSLLISSPELQNKTQAVADAYERYCEALTDRLKIYGSSLSMKSQARKQENMAKIRLGLTHGGSAFNPAVNKSNEKIKSFFGSLFK